ncbi:MAG: hypothetical protein M3209_01015 [Acidobacteriota bacterium]|nr:hypothetical protein [Acidobacteriota bacterium]
MSVYLTLNEIAYYKPEIEEEFAAIMKHPWFSARRNARQWLFFKHCFAVLMGESGGDFPCTEKQAINYKFEINDRLQRYYLSFGKPIKFVFSLVSAKKDKFNDYEEADYPSCNGYYLRVSYNKAAPDTIRQKRLLLEKTIAEAIDAEFEVYRKLPELDFTKLEEVFDTDGSRYKEIVNIAKKHRKRGWIIQNEMNPSTKRLIDIKIKNISENGSKVHTSEYWLLMWWSVKEEKYAHTYKEMNRQTYYLIWNNNRWLVRENIYEKPRTSTPRRNIRS